MFVAFTFGLALPMLFPICLFGVFNIYCSERFLMAYFYRQPPLLDNKINIRALEILNWAPVFMMLSAYWQLGNRQMFFGEF